MTIKEVYDMYKHLDALLSDAEFMQCTNDDDSGKLGSRFGRWAHEMWLAIKAELKV